MPLAPSIADALRREAVIIAASPRAARALLLRFAEEQRAAGRTLWPSPAIHDWDSWLRDLWREHTFVAPDAPTLLTPLQEQLLWKRAQRDDASLVLSPDSMAALAIEAWSLLSAFNAHSARRQSWGPADEPTDAERFRNWAAEFHRECSRHGWLSPNQLESTLLPLLTSGAALTLPPEILLVGFDRITPAQQDFLAALESRGITITNLPPEPAFAPEDSDRSWIVANHRRDEISACAAWARDLLLENPAARIGVIVPSIAAERGEIDRIFRCVLMPATEDIRQPSPLLPWEFSLGEPLAGVPAIRAALLLLHWIAGPLHEDEISWLLLSGFVANTVTNYGAVASSDARQRRSGLLSPQRSLAAYRASTAGSPALSSLHAHLGSLVRAVEANAILSTARPPSAFADLASVLLDSVSWPGPRPADSTQFQALQRWQRLLDEIALLDFDGTLYSWRDFVDLLDRHAQETIFAPESHDAPIQIMGPFESSGQQFDALWFMGVDDTAWPPRTRLHPLLPAAVQRQSSMPHAARDDNWNLARTVTTRLLNSAPRIVFSYAQRDKDAELRPSPLIASLFSDIVPQPAGDFSAGAEPLRTTLVKIPDDATLPWPSEQNAGGATVLKSQAACAFQAFASKRFAARALEKNEWGLTPADKGKLLHTVLQRLFSASEPGPIHSRDDLVAALATNALGPILDVHIDAALSSLRGLDPADPWQKACLAAEKRRLRARLSQWLAKEARRQPFTVEACEQTLSDVHIGDLQLNLRADRIDLLADGSRLLIDYKTGQVSPALWEGERPADPQLPLYAAYGNVENVSGILFAQIRAKETSFEGRVRDARNQLDASLSSQSALVNEPYSEAMRDEWARALENLAAEFLRGEAAVSPRDAKVCGLCDLHSLCRIAESNLASITVDEEEIEAADE
ncbi:MAG: PD-(D/E)XK nuclease family protein [Acidobacteriaceae bacterium]